MRVISNIDDFLSYRKTLNQSIALVPTMGNLHAGHLSLVEKASELAEIVIVTIFVNPMQFGANEDLDKYPRTLEADLNALEKLGVAAVFTPDISEIYPEGVNKHTQVSVPELSDLHCGEQRPGHFTGVASIVTKLFNICRADVAVFGQKDYQQLAIIRKMTRDLAIQTKIVGEPTVRNASGLALSSRNNYLSAAELEIATGLYKSLNELKAEIESGQRDYKALSSHAIRELNQSGFDMEYVNIVDQEKLQPVTDSDTELVILVAGKLGPTRLIDNIEIFL